MANKSVSVILTAATGQYQAAMGQASATAARFGAATTTAGGAAAASGARIAGSAAVAGGAMSRMSKIGMGLKTAVANPFAAIASPAGLAALAVVGTAKAAINFESAWAGVTKTVEGTPAQLARVKDGIRDMAKEIPASTTEIAKVAEAAGQLGIETDSILSFSRVMIDLGNTTNLSADEAATALARLANITQMPQSQFDRLGATIVDLGNNFETTEAEIVEMGLRIAGAGNQVGMTEAEILSFATALSSVGVKAQAGGTAISKVMIEMASDVDKGGKNLKAFAEVAGVSSQEFAARFRDDAAGAIALFIDGLSNMKASGESLFPVLEELGFSEIRVRDALLRLSGAQGLVNETLELGDSAWRTNTALTEEAEKRYETTAAQLEILWNNINDLAISIGETLLPAINNIAGPLADFVGFISDAVRETGSLIEDITTVGGRMDTFAGMKSPFELLRGDLKGASEETVKWTNDLVNLAKEIGGISGQTGKFTDNLVIAARRLGEGSAKTDEFGGDVENAGGKVQRFAGMTKKELKDWKEDVRGSFDVVGNAFDVIGEKSHLTAEKIFRAFEKQINAILEFEDNMRKLARKGLPPEAAAIIAEMGEVGAQIAAVLAEQPRKNIKEFGETLERGERLSANFDDKIRRIFTETSKKTPGIGLQISHGLAEGIKSGMPFVVGAAEAVAAAAISKAKAQLQIQSPSKVFREIGEDAMEGLALGIEEGSMRVERATERAAGRISKVFRSEFKEGRAKFGDILGADFGEEPASHLDVIGFLEDELQKAERFSFAMAKIGGQAGGVGLDPALLKQIAAAGPAALELAEGIAVGGSSAIARINTLLGEIGRVTPGAAISAINAQEATINAGVVNLVPLNQVTTGNGGSVTDNRRSYEARFTGPVSKDVDQEAVLSAFRRMELLAS